MSRKHYRAIAAVFAMYKDTEKQYTSEYMRKHLAEELAYILKVENQNFDKQTFLDACEVN